MSTHVKRKKVRTLALCYLILQALMTVCTPPVCAETASITECRVKAGFLYRFAIFIDWPEKTFLKDNAPLRVCIFNGKPCENAFDILDNKYVNEHPVEVLYYEELQQEDKQPFHVLYINSTDPTLIKSVLQQHRLQNVLTVGHLPDFARMGGIINFYKQDNKFRFEINPAAARLAGLRISSQLLKLARIIKESEASPKPILK